MTQEHFCQQHNTAFFKTANMKSYAHKLPDGSWHNELANAPPSLPRQAVKEALNSLDDNRNRSMCLSYAKDLACAGKIGLNDITKVAGEFLLWIKCE